MHGEKERWNGLTPFPEYLYNNNKKSSRFDFDRYGLVPRSSPRQADLILTTGGMFSTDSYSTVRVVDKLIHVDVYLPGCPPKPETVIDAITKLRKKIAREIYKDRIRPQR
ncbi:hypothetical protein F2Q69_00029562, partial [Brassica cretica]